MKITLRYKGSASSGNYGHAGRPGKVGGSAPGAGFNPGIADFSALPRHRVDMSKNLNSVLQEAFNEYRESFDYDILVKYIKTNASEISAATGVDKAKVEKVMRSWAKGANSGKDSVALQQAAAQEFGLQLSAWQQENYGKIINKLDPAVIADNRKILRAMYDRTQRQLREAGIAENDYVTVFRGYVIREYVDANARDTIDYNGNMLESWTADYEMAREFIWGSGEDSELDMPGSTGFIVAMRVPARNVFSNALTGLGVLDVSEFVIFGSVPGQQAEIVEVLRQ